MSFWDSGLRWHDDYDVRRLAEEKERLERELESQRRRRMYEEHQREQDEYRERERRQSELSELRCRYENDIGAMEEQHSLDMEFLRLCMKFGVEVDE